MSTSNGSEEISKKKLLLLTQVGGGISKWNRFSNMSDIDKEDDSVEDETENVAKKRKIGINEVENHSQMAPKFKFKPKIVATSEAHNEEEGQVEACPDPYAPQKPDYSIYRKNTSMKSSLSGLPSSIPSKPLKENKAKPSKFKNFNKKEEEEESETIDTYFASIGGQQQDDEDPGQKPDYSSFRPSSSMKSSLSGLPSSIPSRPLKENKSSYQKAKFKKQNKDEDEESIDSYFQNSAAADVETNSTKMATAAYSSGYSSMKTSLAGVPSSVPSRPLKENKTCFVKPQQTATDDDLEPQQRKSSFRTAGHQMSINAQKKGTYQPPQKQPIGLSRSVSGSRLAGSFRPPMLNYQQNGGSEQPIEEEIIDERLKNIDPKMIELIENEIMDNGTPITWDDIAGLKFVKTTVKEIVVFPLLRPDIFHGLRGPPKGLLLFGPPGTGKTLIGKCIASQSKSTFFSISASSLTSKWVGEGEKMVRALFAVARVHQPSVVFIDEIDSVLSSRSENEHESSRRIKTEFLVQLDGASTLGEERILVVGATNRPQDLDEAARRRLVKRLYVPLPEIEARNQIVQNLLLNQTHSLTEEIYGKVAELTDGYSGADMANLCKEAAMGPIRSLDYSQMEAIRPEDVRSINFDDFQMALKQVKASVSNKDLQMYHDWNSQYGSTGK